MTINIWIILALLGMHTLFDFWFQAHWMATNKSRCNKALGSHVAVYTGGLILFAVIVMHNNQPGMLLWILVNSVMHFCTDWATSRITSRLWGQQRWHDFFCVVGSDQLIHYVTLISTYILLR